MNIGAAISKIRKMRGVRQFELAEAVGIEQSYASMIETGRRNPSMKVIEKIATHLDYPVPFLLLLAVEENDIPDTSKHRFSIMYPVITNMIHEICKQDQHK